MKTIEKSGAFVAYYRVSTKRQGQSGLGLDAQRKAVMDYLNGGKWHLIGELVEVESGRRANRPQLKRALDLCKAEGATLIIARMDRLSRNVHFVTGLKEAGIEFLAVDNPHATELLIHVMVSFAQEEARMTSERTKVAIAAARARGVKWGTFSAELARRNAAAADARAQDLAPIVAEIRAAGVESVRGICDELNRRGVPTARIVNKKGALARWHVPAVFRLLKRIGGGRRRTARRRIRRAVRPQHSPTATRKPARPPR